MKITSAFAEPPDGPDRSTRSAHFSFSARYPGGSLFPPPGRRRLPDVLPAPLNRLGLGFVSYPSPVPARAELVALPLDEESALPDDGFDSPAIPSQKSSPELAAPDVLLRAVDHALAAYREILDLVERRHSARPMEPATTEHCHCLLDECEELEAWMSRLFKLAERMSERDEPAAGPAGSAIPISAISPERNRQRGALLPARRGLEQQTKKAKGAASQLKPNRSGKP